jgi:hypothetical protein
MYGLSNEAHRAQHRKPLFLVEGYFSGMREVVDAGQIPSPDKIVHGFSLTTNLFSVPSCGLVLFCLLCFVQNGKGWWFSMADRLAKPSVCSQL